jgi:hypothetical protein
MITIQSYVTFLTVVIPEARFYEARNEPIKPAIWNDTFVFVLIYKLIVTFYV